jgi:pimeloyl-ACP methyl ester carboxylesterase
MTIPRGDINLTVELLGDRVHPPVIFLHGGFETPFCFAKQQELAKDFLVVLPHLRGHGASNKPQPLAAYASKEFGADIHDIIAALDLQRPVLVGSSLSGIIIGDVLASFPEAKEWFQTNSSVSLLKNTATKEARQHRCAMGGDRS